MAKFSLMPLLAFGASGALIVAATLSVCAQTPVSAPPPKAPAPETSATSETIVLAGGCFWGVQAVFQHVEGVERAVSGYAGGTVANPSYRQVSSGTTGHAESVEVTFDPRKVGLGEILRVFFSVALDPTQVNRQGPDEGTQYRSEIFVADAAEAKFARDYIAELDAAKLYRRPIATKVETLAAFYPAESYHQNYATEHPAEPYIAYNDAPKVEALKRLFPERYRDKPKLLAAQ
jgi:peptide-methionine (S)-S-oxide reductase